VRPPTSSEPAWEAPRRKGLEAFGERKWSVAYTHFEEAEKLGAKDVAEKKVQARAKEEIEKGERQKDEDSALAYFENARRILNDETVNRLIKRTTFQKWSKSAEKNQGGDWSKAADDWKRAIDFAEESQVEEMRQNQKFCLTFSYAPRG